MEEEDPNRPWYEKTTAELTDEERLEAHAYFDSIGEHMPDGTPSH
ncbi:hypothetical protein C9F11_38270 [Streptomyces sp. YIM 121038]|nr:hypothetical protein [Streptomyces sp. YIM 121038]QCX81237.1 hypothetical protein C9F11_38270 [Streptomyces sp. YIM 121038]